MKTDNREELTGYFLEIKDGEKHEDYIHSGIFNRSGVGHRNPVHEEETVQEGWWIFKHDVVKPVKYYPLTINSKTDLEFLKQELGDKIVQCDNSIQRRAQIVENEIQLRRGVHEHDLTHDWNGVEQKPIRVYGWVERLLGL